MNKPMQVLYTYAQEHILYALLAQEPEYKGSLLHADRKEAQLRAMLDGSAQKRLDAMMEEQKLCDFYRGQALFRAGFSLAVELMQAL